MFNFYSVGCYLVCCLFVCYLLLLFGGIDLFDYLDWTLYCNSVVILVVYIVVCIHSCLWCLFTLVVFVCFRVVFGFELFDLLLLWLLV